MPDWCCGGIVWMVVLWTSLLVVVVGGALLVVRALSRRATSERQTAPEMPRSSEALRVLEERYARGDIDQEEFEEQRRHLQ